MLRRIALKREGGVLAARADRANAPFSGPAPRRHSSDGRNWTVRLS
jgi:hypothetical protein